MHKDDKFIFSFLVFVYAASAAAAVYMLPRLTGMHADLPAPEWVVATASFFGSAIIYGGLGFLGLFLASKNKLPQILQIGKSNQKKIFVHALLMATGLGLVFVGFDYALYHFGGHTMLQHPEFPASLLASVSAGIGEEIIFRLFLINLFYFLLNRLLFRGRFSEPVYWFVVMLSAIAFSAGHLPAIMALEDANHLTQLPNVLLLKIFMLNSMLSVLVGWYYRKHGLLPIIFIHFWVDVVWHVIWGPIQQYYL